MHHEESARLAKRLQTINADAHLNGDHAIRVLAEQLDYEGLRAALYLLITALAMPATLTALEQAYRTPKSRAPTPAPQSGYTAE